VTTEGPLPLYSQSSTLLAGAVARSALDYPWSPASHSGLLVSHTYIEFELTRGRRLGLARVCEAEGTPVSINQYLVESNVATIDSRVLVVAVGSNASPAVMADKFAQHSRRVGSVLPFVKCTVSGIAVGHSAHVSKRGYIAAAPFEDQDSRVTLWASWLDSSQLSALDTTEPNYQRVLVSASDYPIELENGESPQFYYIYESIHGVLGDGVAPRALTSQVDLFNWLATQVDGHDQFSSAPSRIIARLSDEGERERSTQWFKESGLVRQSTLTGTTDASVLVYGNTPSLTSGGAIDTFRVLATTDDIERLGEQCVVLHHDDARMLNVRSHAVVQQFVRTDASFTARPGMLVRVLRDNTVVRGTARVDQIVRNGLGVERQEFVRFRVAAPEDNRVADFFSGSPHYVACRVHAADLSSVEQDIALVDPIAMRFLGVAQGDTLVLEGVARDGKTVPSVRVRAVELEGQVREFRNQFAGGGLDARFPSAADALGVFPDLPQIFLDSALRAKLNLGSHKLCTVRLRASRRHQLVSQLREVLLILVLAFIGLATLFQDIYVVAGLLLAVLGVAGMVIYSRLQSQLGLMRRKRR
jgi:hypothetical protein